jgi:replication-associated recombination protein RarA
MHDEVMSSIQKAIRRGNPFDAMYWAAELDNSEHGKGAIDRLTVIHSEDVSMTYGAMPVSFY